MQDGCPKWEKREVRRQESGDRMGGGSSQNILHRHVQNEREWCPKWEKREVRRQESGDRMGTEAVKTFCIDMSRMSVTGVQNVCPALRVPRTRERKAESLSKQSVLSVSSVTVRVPAAGEDEDGTNGK